MDRSIVDSMCKHPPIPDDVYRAFLKCLPFYTNGEFIVRTNAVETTLHFKDNNRREHFKAVIRHIC